MAQIPSVPRIITILSIFKVVKNPINVLFGFLERYGKTYFLYAGGVNKTLVTTDPAIIQHVMQRNNRNYEKSEIQTDLLAKYVGLGLLTNTGSSWLRQRRLIQPGFHRDRLMALTTIMQGVIDHEIDQLLEELKTHDKQLDIYPLMLNFAFRIVAKAIFSEDIDEKELREYSDLVTRIQEYIVLEIRMPFMRWYFRWSGKQQHYLDLAQQVMALQQELVQKRRDSGQQRDDLLQMLLDSRYEDTGEPMEDQQLIDEIGILFVAGHETSANALSWAFYLLAQHPEVLAKVKTELDAVVPDRTPTFEDLRQLSYLTQVINESMRLYPPAWITDRVALDDDEIAGVFIPKGLVVMPFIYGVHRREDIWENASQFQPERFAASAKKEHDAFAFMPFGGGPRLCIGNSFAMMEMQLVLAAFVRSVDFQLDSKHQVEAQALITLRPRNGIMMNLSGKNDAMVQ